MEKKNKISNTSKLQKYYVFILYLVVVVLVNLVGVTLFFRIDLTSNGLYSISKASKKAVSTLEEPLIINVFFSQNLPAPYNNVERYLHDLLEEYESHARGNLSYIFYDVSAKEGDISEKAEENRKIAHSYGIYPVNVQKIEQDESKVQRAYMGMVLIHGDVIEKLPAVISTEGLEYTITHAIQKMNNKISALANLTDKIKVKLVLSSSMNKIKQVVNLQGIEGLKALVANIVQRLNSKTYNQLQFFSLDPSMGEGTPEELKSFERFLRKWPEIPFKGTVIPAGQGMVAIGVSYGDKSVERNLLNEKMALTNQGLERQFVVPEEKEIENFILDNIDNLIEINEDVGYLSSHGTLALSDNLPPQMRMMQQQMPESLQRFNSLVSKEYTIKEIKAEETIPESIDTLIIAGAKENFTDWELFQIDQFLMKGKSLAIFLDAFREIRQDNRQQMYQMQQPVYLPLNTGLERLLNHYGLTVKKSYLLDENCYTNRDRNNNEMPFYYVPIIKDENINHDPGFLENIKQLIAVKISPLESDEKKIEKSGLELTNLFFSSDRSWEMSGRINLLPYMINPKSVDEKDKKSRPLAYLLEGKFPSYFTGKPIPEKPEKKEEAEEGEQEGDQKEKKPKEEPKVVESKISGEKEILNIGKPGKIFLIGSSEILKDTILDEEGNSPNAVFLLNVLDYLNNREEIAIMRSKNQRFNPIKDTKPFIRTFIKVMNIGGLPILFIVLGFFIWIRRTTRRRKIRLMFNK